MTLNIWKKKKINKEQKKIFSNKLIFFTLVGTPDSSCKSNWNIFTLYFFIYID